MTEERRRFFRIDQDIMLDYKPVDAYAAQQGKAADQFSDQLPLELLAEFHQLDRQASNLLHGLTAQHPSVADYLSVLNKKINLLSQHLINKDKLPKHNSSKVNLSEAGIAFLSSKPLYKDSFLALRLVFLPKYIGVVLFAQVIRCTQEKGDQFHIAAKFHRNSEANQQLLAKQIMEAQRLVKQQNQPSMHK